MCNRAVCCLPSSYAAEKKTESLANAESIKLWQIHEPKPCSWQLVEFIRNDLTRFRRAARLRSSKSHEERPLLSVTFARSKHHEDVETRILLQKMLGIVGLCFSFRVPPIFMVAVVCHQLWGDGDPTSGDEDSDVEAMVPAESIESNMELKLHVMGSKMLFTQKQA